jgi:hypothetical protein
MRTRKMKPQIKFDNRRDEEEIPNEKHAIDKAAWLPLCWVAF